MIRTNFRGKLLLLTIVPLIVAQLVTLIAVMQTVQSDVDRRARESLVIGTAIVDEYVSSRSEQLRTSVSVLAADFGLKEAVATTDTNTIRSALQNHIRRVGADIALLTNLEGYRIASSAAFDQTRVETMLASLNNGEDQAFVQIVEFVDGAAFQVFAVPLKAPTTIAWVVVGFRIESGFADRIAALTGLDVAVVETEHSTIISDSDLPDRLTTNAEIMSLPSDGDAYLLHGSTAGYLALSTPLMSGDSKVQIVLFRSVAEAMAPYVTARRWLIIFSAILLMLVAAAAAWISAGVAKPLGILTNAVREISSGEYDACVVIPSADEFGELASNFNAMRTAIAEREQRISHQALHDSLTDLPNRSKIIDELAIAIDSSLHTTIAVLSVRLSRMNEISSTLGHKASDNLIKLAARHLRLNQAQEDGVAHVGTDEFVIVLPGRDVADAITSAEKIENILEAGVTLGRVNIALHTEIGIAMYPQHSSNAADLLHNSMIARQEVKTRGDSIVIFESGREEHFVRQLRIVNDLRSAIQRDELSVRFQPKISLPSGAVCGAEALVRWQHPEYGWLPPDDFIPAAEEAGTIVHLTRHVLTRAMAECRRWQDAGHHLQVSVNISAHDLRDENLPHYVLETLKEHGLSPNQLTLEITENTVMQKVARAITVLQHLRDIGIKISMDDFGTGYSSLAQLKKIPLDELKIDKSFVTTMLIDEQNESIVRTILELAHNMNLEVVAEGIENEETLRYLSNAGCEQAQGYFFGKPVSSEQLLEWFGNHKQVSYKERRGAESGLRRMKQQY